MQPWIYFLISAAFFFLMMRSGCGSHVMGHGHQHHHDGEPSPGSTGSIPVTGPAQVRDPVCGMTIDRATARTSVLRGMVFYFCSDSCRSKFEATPDAFASTTAPLSENPRG